MILSREIEGEEAITSLDGSIQSLTLFSLKKDPSNTILPAGVDKLICFSEIEPVIRIHVRLKQRDENNVKADIDIFSLEGKPILQIVGFHMRKTDQNRVERMLEKETEAIPLFYQISWQPKPLEVFQELKSPWTIISDKKENIEGLELQ